MKRMPRIILPGGAGLLGQTLAPHLASQRHHITILTRVPRPSTHPNIRYVHWDGKNAGPWQNELESADAVINLAGRSVNCRYHARNKADIYNSRMDSTRALADAIAQCKTPPRIWLNASTATIYKHSYTSQDDLTGTIGPTPEAHDEFSLQVATDWEKTFFQSATPHTRKIALRTAMVLVANQPGVFTILRTLARLGLAGKIGPGTQYMSWIHELDFCRAIDFLLARHDLSGPINLAAPNPLPNQQFMHEFHKLTRNPLALPTPTPLLKLGAFFMRTEPELLLKSRHVLPARLQQAGFTFTYPTLREALQNLTHSRSQSKS
jgi:uncharacterized protein (TIGR01777 family)